MERIDGLKQLIRSEEYRNALGLPKEVTEQYELLAQGEYNINYYFEHPRTGQKLLLRINCGSQMHLEHQIEYEANALKFLECSNRTPKVYYVDGSKRYLDYGILVMQYLPGGELNYETQLVTAAECLADIHSVLLTPQERESLIFPKDPLAAIIEECEAMFFVYETSQLADASVKNRIRTLLNAGKKMLEEFKKEESEVDRRHFCLINTELNSTNFLVDEEKRTCFLVDWEKPLYGEPAQDLGHFLAPTTTFWKTDIIFSKEQQKEFVAEYIRKVNGRFDTIGLWERVSQFITITCLRGLTWCAMAWVEYQQPDKLIFNESTKLKLESYLSEEFLDIIGKNFRPYL